MKRDFLRDLGIEDKDTIDKILDENSSDIGKAKGELKSYQDKVSELEGSLKEKETEISSLNTKVGDTDALKQTIAQLEVDKTTLTNDLNTKLSQLQTDHAIENRVRDANAKNAKAVIALLDRSKITYENNELKGIDEQLDALKKANDSSFLFNGTATTPAGTTPTSPNGNSDGGHVSTGKSFADAIASHLKSANN